PAAGRGGTSIMTVDVIAQLAIGQQFADTAATGPLMIGILAAACRSDLVRLPVRRTPGYPGICRIWPVWSAGRSTTTPRGHGGHQTPVGSSGCGRVVHSRLHHRLCAGHRHRGTPPNDPDPGFDFD